MATLVTGSRFPVCHKAFSRKPRERSKLEAARAGTAASGTLQRDDTHDGGSSNAEKVDRIPQVGIYELASTHETPGRNSRLDERPFKHDGELEFVDPW